MPTAGAVRDEIPVCPRCGYDLRGMTLAWGDRCPLDGVCAECGYAFAWAVLFRNELNRPRWSVEYTPRWQFLPAIASTLARSFYPAGFWRSLQPQYSIVWHRLALYAVFWLVLSYPVFAIGHGLVCAGQTRQTVLSLVGANPSGVPSGLSTFLRGLVMPWDSASTGAYTVRRWRFNMRAPGELLSLWHDRYPVVQAAVISVFMLVLLPVTFVLLPQSRRRAKVRWRHVVRIASYVAPMVFPGYVLMVTSVVLKQSQRGAWPGSLDWVNDPVLVGMMGATAAGGTLLFVTAFWYYAIRLYLRMEHPLVVTMSILIVALLGGTVLMSLVHPDLFQELLAMMMRLQR